MSQTSKTTDYQVGRFVGAYYAKTGVMWSDCGFPSNIWPAPERGVGLDVFELGHSVAVTLADETGMHQAMALAQAKATR